jgi:DNA-binding cell septation regulator SpoVG
MKITEIQIVPIRPDNGLVAFASFILNDELYLGSIGVITRPEGGYRLLYPTKKVGLRNVRIFHPISKQSAELIEQAVIKKFEEVTNHVRYHQAYTG